MGFRLSPRRRRILRALLDALRPTGHPLDAEISSDGLLVAFEDFFRHVDPKVQAALPWMLEIMELGTIPFAGRSRTFTRLSPREQSAYLRGWQESALPLRRDLFKGMNAFFSLVYYAQPPVLRGMRYEHQAYAETLRRERYEKFGAEIAAREERLHRGPAEPLTPPAS